MVEMTIARAVGHDGGVGPVRADDVHIRRAGFDHKTGASSSGANGLEKGTHQWIGFVTLVS